MFVFCFVIFYLSFFFFNDTATTEIYTLSLHDALPICLPREDRSEGRAALVWGRRAGGVGGRVGEGEVGANARAGERSEEHTSELQSRLHLVCRLLLEKKKKKRSSSP